MTEEVLFKIYVQTIKSKQEEPHRAQAEELHRQDQFLHEQLLKQNLDLRETHEKSLKEMQELKRFSRVYLRRRYKTKIIRGSGYCSGTYW